ncbi:MAG: hypothetical protein KatS3mg110_2991 [Pirellulaceae bacterium]|nr:MAG: hypothetical protein KatS3mg110_2991 [Pirellulaceae bacterium]
MAYLLLAAIALFSPNPLGYPARWQGHVQDLLHVPGFAVLCWALSVLLENPKRGVALAVTIATLAEPAQALVGRSPSVEDWILGLFGCAAATVWGILPRRSISVRLLATACIVAVPVAWKMPHYIDAVYFAHSFPVLSDLQSPFEYSRWYGIGARLELARLSDGRQVAKAVFMPAYGVDHFLAIYSFYQDWSQYRYVKCDFTVPEQPVRLLVSIRNSGKYPDEPYFNLVGTYAPGRHIVTIDLTVVTRGDIYPRVDLRRVKGYYLVVFDDEPRELLIHRLWLE